MKIGDKIRYKNNGELKTSVITAFGHHHTFLEVCLKNGDSICETQIIEIL